MILEELAQIIVQSVLLFVFFVVNWLKNSATFWKVISQIDALQDLLLVKALEWDHDLELTETEAVLELVCLAR